MNSNKTNQLLTDVFMIHVSKQLDLTKCPLRINLIIKRICYLLYCHMLTRLRIQSRTNKQANKQQHKINNSPNSFPFNPPSQNQPINKQQLQFICKQKLKTLNSSQTQICKKSQTFPQNTPKKHNFMNKKSGFQV